MHRLDLCLYPYRKEFLGIESEPMLTPREKFGLPTAQRRVEPVTASTQDSEPNTLPTELFRPQNKLQTVYINVWSVCTHGSHSL